MSRNADPFYKRFASKEEGTTTVLAVYFTLIFLVMGGLAIDFSKLISMSTKLQITADSVAHAALYSREFKTEEDAVSDALVVAEKMLPNSVHGTALRADDITFGEWDPDTYQFTSSSGSRTAVQVDAQRLASRSNGLPNLLLRMIGYDTFDVTRTSVFSTYQPSCFREGFVAEGYIDVQGNNTFSNGFCVHSNTYVSVNSNNSFEAGTVVSMPDENDIDLPQSGFKTNEGLEAALRSGAYRMRIINRIQDMVTSLVNGEDRYMPSYVNPIGVVNISVNKVTPAMFTSGRRHRLTCTGQTITFDPGTYNRIVATTDCKIKFANGAIFTDTVLVTSNTSATSMSTPAGLQLGDNDSCGPGGGAILITLGSFNAAAGLQMYGSQILALGDVEFAAEANGIEGASIIAGGHIDGSSNADMAFCGQNMNVYEADYYRLVR